MATGLGMATQYVMDEAEIRERLDSFVEAVRAADFERVVSIYAPDLVSFDIVPPLRHLSAEAKKKNWIDVFATYEHPLEYELRDLTLTMGDGLAIGHSLNRISGTLQKTGERNGYWLRWTTGFRKIGGVWLIVHDHVSVPTDFKSGDSLLNLAP